MARKGMSGELFYENYFFLKLAGKCKRSFSFTYHYICLHTYIGIYMHSLCIYISRFHKLYSRHLNCHLLPKGINWLRISEFLLTPSGIKITLFIPTISIQIQLIFIV